MGKPTEEEALVALKKEMRVWCHTPFFVNAGTDDGGRHLQIWLERENPSERLDMRNDAEWPLHGLAPNRDQVPCRIY